jgi:hypothetical protein
MIFSLFMSTNIVLWTQKLSRYKEFQKTQTNHDKGRANFKSKYKIGKSKTRIWSLQNIGSNETLLQKHENNKTRLWCMIVPKIDIEQTKGNMRKITSIYTLLRI